MKGQGKERQWKERQEAESCQRQERQEGQVTETRGAVAEKNLLVPCDVRLGYSIYI